MPSRCFLSFLSKHHFPRMFWDTRIAFVGTGQDIVAERPSNWRGTTRVYYAVVKSMGLIVGLVWKWSLLLEVILRGLLLNVCQRTWCWFCGCLNAGVMAFIWNNFVVWHFELAYLLSSTTPQDLSVLAANIPPPPPLPAPLKQDVICIYKSCFVIAFSTFLFQQNWLIVMYYTQVPKCNLSVKPTWVKCTWLPNNTYCVTLWNIPVYRGHHTIVKKKNMG